MIQVFFSQTMRAHPQSFLSMVQCDNDENINDLQLNPERELGYVNFQLKPSVLWSSQGIGFLERSLVSGELNRLKG